MKTTSDFILQTIVAQKWADTKFCFVNVIYAARRTLYGVKYTMFHN